MLVKTPPKRKTNLSEWLSGYKNEGWGKTTTIRYSLPITAKRAAISITSIEGVKIKTFTLNNKNGEALNINGGVLTAGTYKYMLVVVDVMVDSKKMIFTK